MIHIVGEFWRGLRAWERPARIALALALLALIPMLWLWLAGPTELRRAGLAGLCGLGLGLQVVFMWAWRGLLSDWTQAQRLYLDGDFEGACRILQERRAAGTADMRSLTLLGNALRMRGLPGESELVLREAAALRPDHAFPLTGLGRSLLAQGRYAEAVETLQAAVGKGAPDVVELDLGEALYMAGQAKTALEHLRQGMAATGDPGRRLVATLLLHRLGVAALPDAALCSDGRPWIEAQATRFAGTDYGEAMSALLRDLDGEENISG